MNITDFDDLRKLLKLVDEFRLSGIKVDGIEVVKHHQLTPTLPTKSIPPLEGKEQLKSKDDEPHSLLEDPDLWGIEQ